MAAYEKSRPLIDGLISQVPDFDPEETSEWIESLDGLIDEAGGPRARYVLLNLLKRARERNVTIPSYMTSPYVNSIGVHDEPYFPGDEAMERKYRSWIRWNAAVLVTRAQRPEISVGGHISSYASVATLYEVGLNHFFRGKDHPGGGDQIFFQGHASPGVYARAFLEGRLDADRLEGVHVDGQALATDGRRAAGRELGSLGLQTHGSQRAVHVARGGPERLLRAVEVDGHLAAVLHRDPLPVGHRGVGRGRHQVVLTDRDALLVEDVGDAAREGAHLGLLAVDGHGDVLVDGGVAEGSTGDSEGRHTGDGSGDDFAHNSPEGRAADGDDPG